MADVKFGGLVPYLFYEDLGKAMAWLEGAFGFKELRRWTDKDGIITNAEMTVGGTELWLDRDPEHREKRGEMRAAWTGVWDDPDGVYSRLVAAGIDVKPPVDQFYGVRVLNVTDPEGYMWGVMKRIPIQPRPEGPTPTPA